MVQCATCTRPDFYVNTFFDDLSRKRHPTKKVASNEEDLEAGFFGRRRSFQHSSFIRRFRKRASQAHERESDIFGMLKNILPLSIIGFKNSQRQKTVILSVLRRISACPRSVLSMIHRAKSPRPFQSQKNMHTTYMYSLGTNGTSTVVAFRRTRPSL